MKHKIISGMIIVTFLTTLVGCQTIPEEHKGAAVGAGVGAAAGAAAGAVLGDSARWAVIGGLAGALLGGAIGHYAYDKRKTRDETVQAYGYKGSEGSVLTIEEAAVSPEKVSPGDPVKIKITYVVLNPSPETRTVITEIREITFNGELVGKPEIRVEHADGTYTSTIPIRLPSSARKGVYKVTTTVDSAYAKDTKVVSFTVV